MKRLIHKDEKHNKKQKLSNILECEIIDSIVIQQPNSIIQTPCGKFLIGVEGNSVFLYNLKTKQKFRIAGSVEQSGYQDGTRDESRFHYPSSLTLSKDCKTLFVADKFNCVIRAICIKTGVTTTFVGQLYARKSIDGPKEKACFQNPGSLELSPDGNTLFVADHHCLRTICIATRQVKTIYYEYINNFGNDLCNFTFFSDGKNIIICDCEKYFKYNIENRSKTLLKYGSGYSHCEMSKHGELLFVSNHTNKLIQVVDIATETVICTLSTSFNATRFTSIAKRLYARDYINNIIYIINISEYYTNFKTFTQLQLSKHSFLSRAVIKRFSI
jgi:DNA-binding beta-propeller fold protein YncE